MGKETQTAQILSKLVHGSNLRQKESHLTKYRDITSTTYLGEIREKYDEWSKANMDLVGPRSVSTEDDQAILVKRIELLEQYKRFIDQQHYAEKFDSRSNLHSSVLEEFMYYLFKDLVADFGEHALIGKSHSFKDIFFVPPKYGDMLDRPYAKIEKKDHDFVIGATYQASFDAKKPPETSPESAGEVEVKVEKKPSDYEEVTVATVTDARLFDISGDAAEAVAGAESHLFDVPAVAIECKTYLDKTMLEGSSRAAEEIKARHPNGLYIVVMEYIKLTEAVNLRKYKVDQIYVLRKQKNTDRELRYASSFTQNPIDYTTVKHLFDTVRTHLVKDWTGDVASGLERGWLIE